MERLLEYFRPVHYDIKLNINKETEKVFGHVVIKGEPLKDVVKLHAKNLKVTSVMLDSKAAGFETENDEIILGKAKTIEIKYTFMLNHNMEGVYVSTYDYHEPKTDKIVTEKVVATQFESHYARECFPCVDEPAAKAKFELTIITPELADTVISNMPAKEDKVITYDTVDENLELGKKAKKRIVRFLETPPMSTYLLAFVCGKFHKKTTESLHGVKVTTYCALNQNPKALTFPGKIAADTLDYYDDLFGIKYPLPKLDQVALPDFEAGAMENWGLVTYREACLLADDKSAESSKEYIATVITHELSHQWFGNLVTMAWWDDLWLNESFATVMQYQAADELHPEYHIWQDFFAGDCYVALRRDALPGVQAVRQPVNDPAEIATLFDGAIVYAKGAHLIFMLIRTMGKRRFFAGLKEYFKKHQYGNTTGDDLWAALQKHADFDVKEFMHAWISQPGYPVITDGYQQRFLLNGGTDDTKWPLPKITDDMSGHYLINLSGPEFSEALEKYSKKTLEQKLRLLIDRQLLSKTSLVSSASLLDLLPEFKYEDNETIWEIVATMINDLKVFCPPETKYGEEYENFVRQIVSLPLRRLGLRAKVSESSNDVKLRPLLIGLALYAEDQEVISNLAKQYNPDLTKINPDTRYAVLASNLKATAEEVFDEYVTAYRRAADPDIKSDLLAALTNAREAKNVRKLLKLLENQQVVRPQDHIYLFAELLGNYKTREKTYDWFYKHWDYIQEMNGEKTMSDYIRIAAARIRDMASATRFMEFVDPLAANPAFTRSIEVAKTDILARLRWIQEDEPAMHNRLDDFTKNPLAF
ncbi:M1 family metallopeptidase [Candidatus Saccharibacteria bacterium]|nr:M1 family metallopeptidase [Candidatus Saccharibacteria bacterium]